MRIKNILKDGILGLLMITAIWWLGYLFIDTRALANPIEVYKELPSFIVDDKTKWHIIYSLSRIGMGLIISCIIGVIIGILMGYNKTADKILKPILYFAYPIPKLALMPIVILLLGIRESSKVVMIVLILVFQIITSVRSAIMNIDKEQYNFYKVMGAKKHSIFFGVTIPSITKDMLTSLKIGVGTAISILFFTETYGTKYGLGFYIMDRFQTADYVDMYCGIVVLSCIGFLLFAMIDVVQSIVCKWDD